MRGKRIKENGGDGDGAGRREREDGGVRWGEEGG